MAETKNTAGLPEKAEIRRALELRHGKELAEKFAAASAAVCGLGGLGSGVAAALARAGIGSLHLLDFDRVDLANLNRQQYFVHQIGMYKTDALQENLRQIAPYCRVRTDTVRITEENLAELLAGDMIICEAFDDAEAKAMLINGVLERYPDKFIVGASGMAGMGSANKITTRRVMKRFYLCGDGVAEAGLGQSLFAGRVMACAAHQAHMVMRIIAGIYEC